LMRPNSPDYEMRHITMTSTPEPWTVVLFGSGLLALAFVGRSRFL
jgi:hypothetical protein